MEDLLFDIFKQTDNPDTLLMGDFLSVTWMLKMIIMITTTKKSDVERILVAILNRLRIPAECWNRIA